MGLSSISNSFYNIPKIFDENGDESTDDDDIAKQ